MIFKSKNNGSIFGAYSPCQWNEKLNNYLADSSKTSFIFSYTH